MVADAAFGRVGQRPQQILQYEFEKAKRLTSQDQSLITNGNLDFCKKVLLMSRRLDWPFLPASLLGYKDANSTEVQEARKGRQVPAVHCERIHQRKGWRYLQLPYLLVTYKAACRHFQQQSN